MLQPIVGLKLDGAMVDGGGGRVGRPAWGPVGLLRDLELRMGMVAGEAAAAVRVQRWAARLAALLPTEPFYARSFRVDAVGTAEMLLMWRDGLVEAGWEGTVVAGGGTRLEAFAALEAMTEPAMIAGDADRLAAVEVELAGRARTPYAELAFADDRTVWPFRWQRIFDALGERGTRMTRAAGAEGGAATGTDLGRLQGLIAGGGTTLDGGTVRGDGSLVLVQAATGIEAADVVAAIVAATGNEGVALVRVEGASLLDEGLVAHGLPGLGAKPASPWRAVLQVLPLAVEMIFEPFDPRRALELLGLAVSPFGRRTRYMLSRALCDAPGIGDARWHEAKRRLRELIVRATTDDTAARAADRAEDGAQPRAEDHDGAVRAAGDAADGARPGADDHDAARRASGGAGEDRPGVDDRNGATTASGRAEGDRLGADVRDAARGDDGDDRRESRRRAGDAVIADGDEDGDGATNGGTARADRELAMIEEWFERPRYDAREGAPMAVVAEAVTRVREWLRRRIAAGGSGVDGVAFAQCEQLLAILGEDGRARLDRLAVRQLLDAVGAAGAVAEVSVEQAGRADHVDHPGALLAARDTVVWWNFAAGTARPPHRARWRRTELEALAACGVVPIEPAALLAEETRQWRMAVLAARRRLVLVLPETDRGARTAPHPLWDEIVARLGLDDEQIRRLSVTVAELLERERPGSRRDGPGEATSRRRPRDVDAIAPHSRRDEQPDEMIAHGRDSGTVGADPRSGEQPEVAIEPVERMDAETSFELVNGVLVAVTARARGVEGNVVRATGMVNAETTAGLGLELETEELAELALPSARPVWRVAPGLIGPAARWTVPSLQALIECPLRWVLEDAAALRSGSVPSLPDGPTLSGALGHRLVAELAASGGLARAAADVDAAIDRLLPGVAAWWLQPGMAFELVQLRHQLRRGIDALAALLDHGGMTIAGVEEDVAGDWLGGTLAGRLDMRLRDRSGRHLILDLKWGHRSYCDLLVDGRAVQLAFYAQAQPAAVGDARVAPAAYFSLGRGRLLATDVTAFGVADIVEPVVGPGVDDVIARIATTVPRVQAVLAAGVIPVTGVAASAPLLDAMEVPVADHGAHYQVALGRRGARREPPGCQYCRFGPICGQAWEGLT